MSEEFNPGYSKAKYVVVAAAAVFFLFILPGIVLAIASNMTDIDLRITRDKRPIPEYELLKRRILTEGAHLMLQVPENTSDKEIHRVIKHAIANRIPLKRKTVLTIYIYNQNPSKTRSRRGPRISEADRTYLWSLTKGINRVENGDPSIPKAFTLPL